MGRCPGGATVKVVRYGRGKECNRCERERWNGKELRGALQDGVGGAGWRGE